MSSRTPRAALLAALLVVAGTGCASVPVERVFSDAADEARQRTGLEIEWRRAEADARRLDAEIARILAEPLDADRAARVALLSSPRLQERFAELGRAAAASVQAGLPPNPFLEITARFRDGDSGMPQLELSIVEELLGLFLLPARKRLAAAELERARLDLAGAAVTLAARAREALVRYQAERELLELEGEVLAAAEAAWEMARQLREAGNVSRLDLLAERDLYERTKLEVAERELRVADARERVNAVLGLWGERAATWRAQPWLPEPPADEPLPGDVERRAVERSLDVAAAMLDLEAAARRLRITDVTALLRELDGGVEGEREVETGEDGSKSSEWFVGPTVGFELPVFDQGRPRRLAAQMELRGRWEALAALGVEVRSAARRSAARLAFARQRALYTREVLVPLREAITAETELHYNAMFVGVFDLLDAKSRELDAARAHVAARRDYWLARGGLDALLAGRMPPGGLGGLPEIGTEATAGIGGENAEEEH